MPLSLSKLDNLVRIGQLKAEPRNEAEGRRMLAMARTHLKDARLAGVSREGRFISAYTAGHAAALAILRWHGYRSENRYLVFQCLEHTLGFTPKQWLLLDQAHKKRNLAEYEGDLDVTVGFVEELIEHAAVLIAAAQALEIPS